MKVVAEVDIPDGWFRAPNGNNVDAIWCHVPAEPHRPLEIENEWTLGENLWKILAQVVPAACPSHPLTPGYFPCGNVCAQGHSPCPVELRGAEPAPDPAGEPVDLMTALLRSVERAREQYQARRAAAEDAADMAEEAES